MKNALSGQPLNQECALHRHRGFSFAEVMFSVVILGVGFIMVAAIFPVAAEQTRDNTDQSIAAQLAKDAFQTIANSTVQTDYGGSAGSFMTLSEESLPTTPNWDAVARAMVCTTDRRYACVPIFCKGKPGDPIEVTVMVVRRWVHDSYTVADLQSEYALDPRGINITQITKLPDGSFLAQIERGSPTQPPYYQAIASGTYMLIKSAGDNNLAGHVLQIGEYKGETADSVYWTLAPTSRLGVGESCNSSTNALILGRDFTDDSKPYVDPLKFAGFSGAAQDVAVFQSFINPK